MCGRCALSVHVSFGVGTFMLSLIPSGGIVVLFLCIRTISECCCKLVMFLCISFGHCLAG